MSQGIRNQGTEMASVDPWRRKQRTQRDPADQQRSGWLAARSGQRRGSKWSAGAVVQELKRQGLTGGDWDYLEPHAMELTERIRDGELRNLHVMEG